MTEHILAELGLGIDAAAVGRQHFQAVKAAGKSPAAGAPGGGGAAAGAATKRPRTRRPKARAGEGGSGGGGRAFFEEDDEQGGSSGGGAPPPPYYYDSEELEEEEGGDAGGGWGGSEASWEAEERGTFDDGGWGDEPGGGSGVSAGATTASVRDMLRQLLNRLKLLHPTIARVDTPSQTHDLVAVAHKCGWPRRGDAARGGAHCCCLQLYAQRSQHSPNRLNPTARTDSLALRCPATCTRWCVGGWQGGLPVSTVAHA